MGSATAWGGGGWGSLQLQRTTFVCASPCDTVVDGRAAQGFTLEGDFPTSSAFTLHDKAGYVTLSVSPGSRGLKGGGLATTIVGGTGALVGAALVLVGVDMPSTPQYDANGNATNSGSSSLPVVGGVTLGVGGALLIAGIVMMVNGRTSYELKPSTSASSSTSLEAGRLPGMWALSF